jgi:glutamate-1-semialdehyde 2,1-aminomutase
MNRSKSQAFFQQAQSVIPGGVNSPVRACRSVGTEPLFIDRGEGCRVYDSDGNAYIDYVGSWGPLILGHRHPQIIAAIQAALERGTSFGAPTELEIKLAELVVAAVPSVEVVRMVNSGTEATMSAIRLARGFTGRDKIIKFDGCYHGHGDALLVQAGSGVATLGIPGSPGIPPSVVQHTLSVPFNDLDAVAAVMQTQGAEVACIIVEPVAGNMGLVKPVEGFLEGLRELCTQHGSLLIFDEVMTGFRVAYGGAQALYGVTPDVTCLGKIIGGGMPVGAYGGKKEIMARIAPQGDIYQAGTLSGNPVAMAAGIAMLTALQDANVYRQLEARTRSLVEGLAEAAAACGIPAVADQVGSMFGFFLCQAPVHTFDDAKTCDLDQFCTYYQGMLTEGIYLAPSQFEAGFVSTAHEAADIEQTVAAARKVLQGLA